MRRSCRASIAFLALITSACAVRSHYVYSPLESVACGGLQAGEGEVVVWVHDPEDYPLPEVAVQAIQTDAALGVVPFSASGVTDAKGRVILRLAAKETAEYALTVALIGFEPELRLLTVKPGCAGHLRIALRVREVDEIITVLANGGDCA